MKSFSSLQNFSHLACARCCAMTGSGAQPCGDITPSHPRTRRSTSDSRRQQKKISTKPTFVGIKPRAIIHTSLQFLSSHPQILNPLLIDSSYCHSFWFPPRSPSRLAFTRIIADWTRDTRRQQGTGSFLQPITQTKDTESKKKDATHKNT
jgi:hypothetical protein